MFQTYFLLKPRIQKYSQFFIFLIFYLHCTNTIVYFYDFIFSVINKTANTTKCNCAVIILQKKLCYFQSELVSQTLLKTGFTNVTRNRFTNLLKISFTKLAQNLLHKCYLKLVSRVLLKIGSTSVIQNRPKNVTQNWFQ